MDTQIFQFINQFAGRWPILDGSAIYLAKYSGYLLIGTLAVLIIVNRRYWHKIFFWALAAVFISRFVVTEIIRFFYSRPRPFEALDVTQLIAHGPEASLPSGHAAFYFALAWFVFFINKKLGTVFLVVTLLMTLARVFSGIHYPSDILAGAGVGLLSAAGVYFAYKKWGRNL
ncbi:MAG: phosphatase PAP2 family protein [Candidatus Spechtbacterales bacterium]